MTIHSASDHGYKTQATCTACGKASEPCDCASSIAFHDGLNDYANGFKRDSYAACSPIYRHNYWLGYAEGKSRKY